MEIFTAEYLRNILNYNSFTGIWTKNKKIAGYLTKQGYIIIQIDYIKYYAHRLAWFYMKGEWPPNEIDHIDKVKSNNRFNNLRLATSRQNSFNVNIRSNNTSGIKGVYWNKSHKKWQAQIKQAGKQIYLGRFINKEEAGKAVAEARILFHGKFSCVG